MMDLVVQEKGNDRVVSARDLYEFLEVKSNFTTWIKRKIKRYSFVENKDFIKVFQKRNTLGGTQKSDDYLLKLDTAKEIAIVESNAKGKQARDYFIEVEKKYKEKLQQELEESRDELEVIAETRSDNTVEGLLLNIGLQEIKVGRELSLLKRMYAELELFSGNKINWIKQLGFKTDVMKKAVVNGEPRVMHCLDEKE